MSVSCGAIACPLPVGHAPLLCLMPVHLSRRDVAGLWTTGSGEIECPLAEDMFFLPQQPFMPLGTLRQQLLFPSGTPAHWAAHSATHWAAHSATHWAAHSATHWAAHSATH